MKTTTTHLKSQFIFKAMLLLSILAIASKFANSQNLATNSGFSAGSSSWSSGCSIEVNPETAYGGLSSTNLITEIDAERCFNQDICVLPGITYTFSFKAGRRPQSGTPASPGMTFNVTGLTTGTNYVNQTKTYSNTVFLLQTETYSFTIPAAAADRKVNIAFVNAGNTSTYGVLLDDIQLAPGTGSTLSINGADILSPGLGSNWSVNNATAAITSYNWNFGNASTPVSSLAAPANIQWSAIQSTNVSVALSNGSCSVVTLSRPLFIINQLLAVQLMNFTGVTTEGKNQLSWSTQNEENNRYFIIERSADGATFDSIGVVLAAGGTANNYSFADAKFKQINNYYRLHQVDVNGVSKNSNAIIIKNIIAVKSALQLFPNPAIAVLHFQLNCSRSTTVMVQVINRSGNAVVNEKQSMFAGNNQHSININNLETGIYFLKITNQSGSTELVQPFSKI